MRLEKAKRAYRDFTGHEPREVYTARLDDKPVAGYRMGSVVGVAYEATRDGVKEQYFHRFKNRARPDLVSKDDGSQLYILGGDYHVTDRGIEDMPLAMIVNPSRRPSKRRGKKRSTTITVRANPSPRRRRRRRSAGQFRANPAPRRRRRPGARRRLMRMRRNPIRNGGKMNLLSFVTTGIMVGAGAVGTEIVMGYLPLPANLKQGALRHVTKGGLGIGIGLGIAAVLKNKRLGAAFAVGACTIAAHDWIKEMILKAAPGIPFGQYMNGGMGQYLDGYNTVGDMPALGYYNPGQPINDFAGAPAQNPIGI